MILLMMNFYFLCKILICSEILKVLIDQLLLEERKPDEYVPNLMKKMEAFWG